MKAYMQQFAEWCDNSLEELCSKEGEAGQARITNRLMPGSACAWCFVDDVAFWKAEGECIPYPAKWPYRGFIIPLPETDGRNEMEAENVCVVAVDYPIEKENPVTDWVPLSRLLTSPGFHRFYVFETIKLGKSPPRATTCVKLENK